MKYSNMYITIIFIAPPPKYIYIHIYICIHVYIYIFNRPEQKFHIACVVKLAQTLVWVTIMQYNLEFNEDIYI